MSCKTFITALTGRVYKVLPMKERECKGENLFLDEYLKSLSREIKGGCGVFPMLSDNADYVTVMTSIEYLSLNDFTLRECRSDILKSLRLLNRVKSQIGDS